MITLINGFPQGPNGLIVPNGSIKFALNVDATVIAAPGGFVAADVPAVFQFDGTGALVQPAKIWSNRELNPQLSPTLLGTYYLVTFYDQNGAILNSTPMWWQFPEVASSTVDISIMTPISTVGGNVIFYPTNFGASNPPGTVTSVTFTGDGTVLSATPSAPVTLTGTVTATLNTQSANLVLAGPASGPAAAPTFRALVTADLPAVVSIWNLLSPATGNLILANTTFNSTFNQTSAANWTWANITAATAITPQNSPNLIVAGTYWTGAVSAVDAWTIQNVVPAGANPGTVLTITHSGSPTTGTVSLFNVNLSCGSIISNGMTAAGNVSVLNGNSFNMQSSNAASAVRGQSSEEITLSLAGTTTDSSTNLLPAGAIIDAVVARVTQTISGGAVPTTWEAGDPTTAARFISTGNALIAGTTAIGLNQMAGSVTTDAAGPTQPAAAKVRITLDQIPGQGKVRVTVFWTQFTAPTS